MSSRRARAAIAVLVLGVALGSGVPALAAGGDPTSTAVVCSPSSVVTGTATTCTATVTDTASTPSAPTGTVSFTSSGGTFSADGACTLSEPTSKSSSCGVSFTPGSGGGPIVNATYTPATTEHAQSSGSTSVTAVDSTGTTVSCPSTGATVGDPITCTATVSDPTGVGQAITGSISFSLSPDAPGSVSGVCASSGSTDTSAFCTVTFTPPQTGSYALTASYGGDTYHAASTGTASIGVQSGASTETTPAGSTSLAESGAAVLPSSVTSASANSGPSLGVVALRPPATLASRRRANVKVSCTAAAGAGCDGTVALYLKVVVTRKAATGKAATGTTRTPVIVELGVGKLALRQTGKKGATVKVGLSRTGARLIAALLREHRRSVRVTALIRQAGVTSLSRVLSLSLVTPKKHAKKRRKKK